MRLTFRVSNCEVVVMHGGMAANMPDGFPRIIGLMIVAVLVSLPPMLVGLGDRGPNGWHEAISLASSQETWLRVHKGEHNAWLFPSINGQTRIAKPPLLVWLNMVSWLDLEPAQVRPETLIVRARWVAVIHGLLTVIALFWLGCALRDAMFGFMAALVGGGCFYFLEHSRMSSYDIVMLAWCALAVAAAVWAMAPRSTNTVSRQLLGWGACGVFVGLAWLTKGPLALVIVFLGVTPAIALLSRLRGPDSILLGGALVVAAIIALPWHWFLAQHESEGLAKLAHEYSAPSWDIRPPWYYIFRINLTLPWTLWLLAGLFHPFLRARGQLRRIELTSWIWFVLLLAVFSAVPPKVPRYVLPLLPAMALVIAHVWRDHEAAARQANLDAGARWMATAHYAGLALATLCIALWLAQPSWLVQSIPGVAAGQFEPWSLGLVAVLGVLLLGLTWFGWRRVHSGRPLHSLIMSALWASAFATILNYQLAQEPTECAPLVSDFMRVSDAIGDDAFCYLHRSGRDAPSSEFLFYTRRIVMRANPRRLDQQFANADRRVFMMATLDERNQRTLEDAGFVKLSEFRDEPNLARGLWLRDPANSGLSAPGSPASQEPR
jgi:4-amino-4-deoxy-L-arabinose transferase-like glycosyltransferase